MIPSVTWRIRRQSIPVPWLRRGQPSQRSRTVLPGATPASRVDPSPDSLAAPATRAGIHRIVLYLPEHTTGDVIMLSPVLAALHRDYPGAQIDALVTGEGAATIFAQFPNFGSAFVLPRSCWLRPWSWIRVMRAFRRERYDLAIDQALDDRAGKRGLPACRTSRRVRIGDH